MIWLAKYNDGTSLSQYNADGKENKYTDINRSKLSKFLLLNNNRPVIVIHLDKNKRLIYRKRIAMPMDGGLPKVIHLVGWQENRNGINIQSLCFVFPDGHVEVIDKFREDAALYSSVRFLPEEKL